MIRYASTVLDCIQKIEELCLKPFVRRAKCWPGCRWESALLGLAGKNCARKVKTSEDPAAF